MATIYDGINYFPVGVNFMEENAMEVIEAKYGIKGSAIVLKLLCKIYKEGYFIRWDEEQCLIFANKAGREVQAAEVQGIIEILFIKGIMDKNSYLENGILTSENIQKVWMEATKRRKRELSELPYLMVKTEKEKENDKPEKESDKPDNASTQQEIERPKPLKEGKVAGSTGDVAVSPGNVVHDVAVNAKNACNSGQSKVKEKKAEENKEFPPSAPPRGKEEEVNATPVSMPGYAFNTMTHNYVGLMGNLERFGITDEKEIEAILRLSDYGRKGTPVWKLICSTNWSNIGAKGKYMIAALNRAKKRSGT